LVENLVDLTVESKEWLTADQKEWSWAVETALQLVETKAVSSVDLLVGQTVD